MAILGLQRALPVLWHADLVEIEIPAAVEEAAEEEVPLERFGILREICHRILRRRQRLLQAAGRYPSSVRFLRENRRTAPSACSLASRRLATAFSASAAIPFTLLYSASSVISFPTLPLPSRTSATIELQIPADLLRGGHDGTRRQSRDRSSMPGRPSPYRSPSRAPRRARSLHVDNGLAHQVDRLVHLSAASSARSNGSRLWIVPSVRHELRLVRARISPGRTCCRRGRRSESTRRNRAG